MKKLLVIILLAVLCGCAMTNMRIVNALQQNKIYVGMSKQELVSAIGYPPNSSAEQTIWMDRYTVGTCESGWCRDEWTYEFDFAPDMSGSRCVTYIIENDKVTGWYKDIREGNVKVSG